MASDVPKAVSAGANCSKMCTSPHAAGLMHQAVRLGPSGEVLARARVGAALEQLAATFYAVRGV